MINGLSNLLHDFGRPPPVPLGVHLGNRRGTVAEKDACSFQTILLAKAGGRVVTKLVRVPPVTSLPMLQLVALLRCHVLRLDLRERRMWKGAIASSCHGVT